MTSQSGGGGASYPDVAGDGLTPGGLTIQGAITAGYQDNGIQPPFFNFQGNIALNDSAANAVHGDDVLFVSQSHSGSTHNAQTAATFERDGTVGASDYSQPIVAVRDFSDSAQPLYSVIKNGVTEFQVDTDGVQVHGKFKTGASVAHVLGAYSGNAVPIYNEAGTLLGYMPLYA